MFMNTLLKWVSITHRLGKIYLDKNFEQWGINSTQHFFILRICENEGITQDKLPSLIHLNKSNIARALSFLEKEGFIRKDFYQQDKRTVRLYPTEKARVLYDQIHSVEDLWRNILMEDFSEEERKQFISQLEKVGKAAIVYTKKMAEGKNSSCLGNSLEMK